MRLRNLLFLGCFVMGEGPTFTCTYDFGDDWRHTVKMEKLLAVKPAPKIARLRRFDRLWLLKSGFCGRKPL